MSFRSHHTFLTSCFSASFTKEAFFLKKLCVIYTIPPSFVQVIWFEVICSVKKRSIERDNYQRCSCPIHNATAIIPFISKEYGILDLERRKQTLFVVNGSVKWSTFSNCIRDNLCYRKQMGIKVTQFDHQYAFKIIIDQAQIWTV